MLSLVTAAEHQYRHDTHVRDRELAVLASIRARRAAETEAEAAAPTAPILVRGTRRHKRAVWARPIGRQAPAECPAAACATA